MGGLVLLNATLGVIPHNKVRLMVPLLLMVLLLHNKVILLSKVHHMVPLLLVLRWESHNKVPLTVLQHLLMVPLLHNKVILLNNNKGHLTVLLPLKVEILMGELPLTVLV